MALVSKSVLEMGGIGMDVISGEGAFEISVTN